MTSADKIIAKAAAYIGTKEYPAGSNNVQFNTDYYGRQVSGSAYPWCCVFVWDIFKMAGASDLFCNGNRVAYCPSVENWGKTKGLTIDKSQGQKGDIVLFDFSNKGCASHIGLIEKQNSDGSYTTIEGNTSTSSNDNGGAVMRRKRSQSVVRCIIRPKYSGTASKSAAGTPTTIPSKVPMWVGEVTASTLNVRSGPGTAYSTIKSWPMLAKGNWVDICDAVEGGSWLYIRIAGTIFGYVSAKYIKKVST